MKRSRFILLCTPILLAGVLTAGSQTASAHLPSGATRVYVDGGSTHGAIDGHLHPAASIAGTITLAAGGSGYVNVIAYRAGVTRAAYIQVTGGVGTYKIGGLAASSTGYALCVRGSDVNGGNSTTGYQGRCYRNVPMLGATVPSGADKVALTATQHRTGIDITVPSAAAIAGNVTSRGGSPIASVSVIAHNRSDGTSYGVDSDDTGHYKLAGLTPSARGYSVCFNTRYVFVGTGFRPQCYRNVAWNGGRLPSTSSSVSVSPGHTHGGIDQSLRRGGAISGLISDAATVSGLKYMGVVVFNSTGHRVGSASTDLTGQYVVRGLATSSGYRVCASPGSIAPAVTYHGKCWTNVAWSGGPLPAGTSNISVTAGTTHTGIDLALSKRTFTLGSISGHVRENIGNAPLNGASVNLFSSTGSLLASSGTDADGAYQFFNLRASSAGYFVCAKTGEATTSTSVEPLTGWAPRCYVNTAWDGVTAPTTPDTLPLTAGQDMTGIDVIIFTGGLINGRVVRYATTHPLPNVSVSLFTHAGRLLTQTGTSSPGGLYSFKGLSPVTSADGYLVCFDGRNLPDHPDGFRPQCYDSVAWDGTF